MNLINELAQLQGAERARICQPQGLGPVELLSLVRRPDADPAMYHPMQATEHDVARDVTDADEGLGEEAVLAGEVAFAVLAGGVGTRLGAIKALATIPELGLSMLGLKLLQAGNMPTWVMTSPTSFHAIHSHVSKLALAPGQLGIIFEQFESLRLTVDGNLSKADGQVEMYPLGHGDLGPALVKEGVLDAHPNVKWVVACNVDNVLASPHAGTVGRHIRTGAKITCEVVSRSAGDRGGVLAWANDKLQVAEDFRLPTGFAEQALYLNTNTMVFNVDVLRSQIPWRWHRVRKQVDARLVVQYERLLQQYTEEFCAEFLLVPRDARFLGVKTPEDMQRAGEVLASHRFNP